MRPLHVGLQFGGGFFDDYFCTQIID